MSQLLEHATATGLGQRERLKKRLSELFSGRTIVVGIVIVVVGYIALVPLAYLLIGTFDGSSGGFTVSGFTEAFASKNQSWQMLKNSLIFALGSGALALALGTALAYVHVRTDAPFKGLLFVSAMVPLIIPGVLYAISWIFLADPKVGILNTAIFEPIFGHPVLDIYGLGGMIWTEGVHTAPLAFLLMVGAFRSFDPSLEESGAMSGVRPRTVLRKVTLPLVRPALLAAGLLMFVRALESFEVPTVLGLPRGTYVFTSRIYFELKQFPIQYTVAGAYAVTLLVIGLIAVALIAWLNRHGRSYQTVGGKAFRPRVVPLGRARKWVGAGVALYFAVAVALPLLALIYTSLLKFYQPLSMSALEGMSLHNYGEAFGEPIFGRALRNSFVLAIGTACIVIFISAVASWLVVRTNARGRRLLDAIAFTPMVIPGLVLGLALLFVYLRIDVPVYGTMLILLVAFVTLALPYGMQYSSSAMRQISDELEESATVTGLSWWVTFRRILLPLASGGLVAGWIYVAVVSFRELSAAILVYSPGNEVMSVLIWEQYEDGSFMVLSAVGVILVAILASIVGIAYKLGGMIGLEGASR